MAELPEDRYIIEVALTHDHYEGQRTPDYIQAMAVPLAVDAHAMIADAVGEPLWDEAVPFSFPMLFDIIEQDIGFDGFCERVGEDLAGFDNQPERFEFSVEGPDDCGICAALVETDLRSRGMLA
mgnify:CR=1 FL=1